MCSASNFQCRQLEAKCKKNCIRHVQDLSPKVGSRTLFFCILEHLSLVALRGVEAIFLCLASNFQCQKLEVECKRICNWHIQEWLNAKKMQSASNFQIQKSEVKCKRICDWHVQEWPNAKKCIRLPTLITKCNFFTLALLGAFELKSSKRG